MREPRMPSAPPYEPSFDRIARPYRWLEYLTFGRVLERCRTHSLSQLGDCRRALVLGDGDGRFLARLLAENTHLHADAVDTSAAMLQLLRDRSETATPDATARLQVYHDSALTFPLAGCYDLVVTHFFLDCFSQADLETLIARVASTLVPGALWVVSDFHVPAGLMRTPARALVRSLYLAFRVLTGLRTTELPDHATPLRRSGMKLVAHQYRFGGLLTSELWRA
jgi:SAM-dependent methyltransferase